MTLQTLRNLVMLIYSIQIKENITIVAPIYIRVRKLLLLIILALNLHILFMQSSWQQFLRSLRMGGGLPPHTPPQRFSSFLGGTRAGPGYNWADKRHMGLIEEVCSRPGCRGIFCSKDCQFLLADRKDGKGSKYIDHGNATHSENVKDTRIQEVPHVSNIDIGGNHRPQFIALFKESRAIDKNNFSEVPEFTELLNEKDGEIAKTLQELLRNRDT
jgi:hypothetical protein